MSKYFAVYAAILGVLALLLFMSPQIAKFISADSPQAVETQILKNVDFEKEAINSQVWIRNTNNETNTVKISNNALQISNQKIDEGTSYSLLSQKVSLDRDKFYHLHISYAWLSKHNDSSMSFGIQKSGAASAYAHIYPLAVTDQQTSIDRYFKINDSFKDNYFYVLLSGDSAVDISSLALFESDTASGELNEASSGNLLPIFQPNTPAYSPTPSPSQTSLVSVSATTTPAQDPSPSPAPQKEATKAAQEASSADKFTFYPGWSVVGLDQNSKSDLFSTNNLDGFQMLGGKWAKSSNSQTIFSKNAGVLVYSSNKSTKILDKKPTDAQPSLTPSLGWNLLYNSSDQEITDETAFYFSNGKTQPTEHKLKSLVNDKKASSEVYLLSSNQQGVTLNKISFPSEAIPGKTVFWFYLFKL